MLPCRVLRGKMGAREGFCEGIIQGGFGSGGGGGNDAAAWCSNHWTTRPSISKRLKRRGAGKEGKVTGGEGPGSP